MFSLTTAFNRPPWNNLAFIIVAAGLISAISAPAHAAVADETSFIFNTFSFLIHGLLVLRRPC
jgi:Amt family ammonium transporter